MATILIPLENIPQVFEIALAGKTYNLTVKWNDAFEGGWVLDIQNAETNEVLVCDVPLVTGCNLLDGLDYLEIGGKLFVYTDGDALAVPTLDNLGTECNLYFVTED